MGQKQTLTNSNTSKRHSSAVVSDVDTLVIHAETSIENIVADNDKDHFDSDSTNDENDSISSESYCTDLDLEIDHDSNLSDIEPSSYTCTIQNEHTYSSSMNPGIGFGRSHVTSTLWTTPPFQSGDHLDTIVWERCGL